MSQTLDANLNVISEDTTIEIELLDGDLNIIQKLDDEPNDVGGLTAQELKAKFDESGNVIKKYINETLVPAILEDEATEAARTAAENERKANEQERVSNENARVEAEAARIAAETARAEAESNRATAETNRVSAEQARVAAENARVDSTNGIVAQATAQANAAANSASSALASANAASGSANNASSSANSAASSASSASSAQGAAASSATAAAKSAEEAKQYAEEAKGASGGGVTSFNGRTGAVKPASGDYTADMVGAQAANKNLTQYVDGVLTTMNGEKVETGPGVHHFFITIPTTGWTENSDTGVKSISVAIDGVTADMNGNASPYYNGDKSSDSYAAFVEAKNQFLTYITNGDAETYDGGVTFNVYGDVPTVEIPVMVEVS